MTKLDAGLMTSLPASDLGSAAVWRSKRINPRPQSCLCLTWSGYPSNDDEPSRSPDLTPMNFFFGVIAKNKAYENPKTVNELKDYIYDEFKETDKN